MQKTTENRRAENKTADYGLTIVIPVYNEEGNMLRLEKEFPFLWDAPFLACIDPVTVGKGEVNTGEVLSANGW